MIKEPSPSVIHQRVSRNLLRILEDYFREIDAEGEVFYSPLDVTPSDYNVVQPDIFYVAGDQQSIVKDTHVDGAPKLVVEIISPSTHRKDRLKKCRFTSEPGCSITGWWILRIKPWNVLLCGMVYTLWWLREWMKRWWNILILQGCPLIWKHYGTNKGQICSTGRCPAFTAGGPGLL